MKLLLLGLLLLSLVGCAVFEQTPEDVQQKVTEPTKGKLYVPEPERGY